MSYTYEYPRPALATDCVVFGLDDEELQVLLIERGVDPHRGSWALPGGFVHMDEDLETAARRELTEETGVTRVFLEQLYTFGAPKRDPRSRVVSVAYWGLVKLSDHAIRAATDARSAAWFPAHDPPSLAFDHSDILDAALKRLRGKVRYQPVGFELLPPLFTLRQLQRMYEIILDRTLDKRNFRKRIRAMELLIETDQIQRDVAHRAARLYRFDESRYESLVERGFDFEI